MTDTMRWSFWRGRPQLKSAKVFRSMALTARIRQLRLSSKDMLRRRRGRWSNLLQNDRLRTWAIFGHGQKSSTHDASRKKCIEHHCTHLPKTTKNLWALSWCVHRWQDMHHLRTSLHDARSPEATIDRWFQAASTAQRSDVLLPPSRVGTCQQDCSEAKSQVQPGTLEVAPTAT